MTGPHDLSPHHSIQAHQSVTQFLKHELRSLLRAEYRHVLSQSPGICASQLTSELAPHILPVFLQRSLLSVAPSGQPV